MAQHDMVIDNGPGRAVRLDMNAALAALFSSNSGVVEPAVTVGGQLWFNDGDPTNPRLMLRNAGNSGWLDIAADLSASDYVWTSGTVNIGLDDVEDFIQFSAAGSALLPPASTANNLYFVTISAYGGDVTIVPNGSDKVDDGATLVVPKGVTVVVRSAGDGINWRTSLNPVTLGTITPIIAALPTITTIAATDELVVMRANGTMVTANKDLIGNPPGAFIAFGGPTAPAGYLAANGAAISRTTYASLFAAIGTQWGAGDNSTTFNLPDLRGEFLRGWDNGRGIDTGRAFGSVQGAMVLSHTHGYSDPTHAHTTGSNWSGGTNSTGTGSGGSTSQGTVNNSNQGFATYGNYCGITIAAAGGAEERPRNVAALYAIKY